MNRILPLVVLAASVMFTGGACAPGEGTGRRNSAEESPTRMPETTSEAFAEFSGVALPENLEDLNIRVDVDDQRDPGYLVSFTGTRAEADQTCGQVGNYLVKPRGVSEESAANLEILEQDLADAQEPVWGCSAVIQSTGADVLGIVLQMNDDIVKVYLRAQPFRT